MTQFQADRTNVSFAVWPATPVAQWVVRGEEFKGFGKTSRFAGSEMECKAVARTLNEVHRRNE